MSFSLFGRPLWRDYGAGGILTGFGALLIDVFATYPRGPGRTALMAVTTTVGGVGILIVFAACGWSVAHAFDGKSTAGDERDGHIG